LLTALQAEQVLSSTWAQYGNSSVPKVMAASESELPAVKNLQSVSAPDPDREVT